MDVGRGEGEGKGEGEGVRQYLVFGLVLPCLSFVRKKGGGREGKREGGRE